MQSSWIGCRPTQWAVAIEPETGVDVATGDIIFAGPSLEGGAKRGDV